MGWLQSRRLRFLAACVAAFFVLLVALRAVFYLFFSEVGETVTASSDALWQTLGVGLRFDLRLALLLVLPLCVLAWLPRVNLATSAFMRGLAQAYLTLATLVVVLIYILDFGHYVYLGDRLNVTALRFLEDTAISTQMVWESYPVVWITLGWLGLTALMAWLFAVLGRRLLKRPARRIRARSLWPAAPSCSCWWCSACSAGSPTSTGRTRYRCAGATPSRPATRRSPPWA